MRLNILFATVFSLGVGMAELKGQVKFLNPILNKPMSRAFEVNSNKEEIINPDDFSGLMDAGVTKLEMGEFNAAIYYFKKSLKLVEEYSSPEIILNTYQDQNPYPAYLLGVAFANLGESDSAIFYYNKSLSKTPQFLRVYIDMASLYLDRNVLDSTSKYLELGLRINEESPDLLGLRAQLYLRNGNLTSAIKLMNKSIRLNPTELSSYEILGQIYERQFRISDMEKVFNKAIKNNPQNSDAYAMRALFFYRRELKEQAGVDITKALELDPNNYTVKLTLGIWKLNDGEIAAGGKLIAEGINAFPSFGYQLDKSSLDYEESELAYFINYIATHDCTQDEYALFGALFRDILDGALRFSKGVSDDTRTLAQTHLENNLKSEFAHRFSMYCELQVALTPISELDRINQILNQFEAWNLRVLRINLLLLSGKTDQAIEEIESMLLQKPRDALLHYYSGIAKMSNGQLAKSISAFTTCLSLDPFYVSAYFERGNAFLANKEYKKAILDYQEFSLRFLHTDLSQYRMAKAHFEMGDLQSASDLLDEGQKLWPDFEEFYALKGDIHFENGDYDQAIYNYEESLIMNGNLLEPRQKIGKIHLELENFREAVRVLSNCIYKDPDNAENYKLRADAHFAMRKYKLALEDYLVAKAMQFRDEFLNKRISDCRSKIERN